VKEREEKDETNDCLDLVRERSLWRNFNLYRARRDTLEKQASNDQRFSECC
jgi:hypothetical protein